MKILQTVLLFFLLNNQALIAQILTDSNLPIIIINTGDSEIPDEPKIPATMGIIYNGAEQINNVNDTFNNYNGHVGIETRGNSTQGFEKKTYTVELWDEAENEISASLLGMAKEEDWILHAMFIDKTQLRIPMSFYLARQMGHYAANWRYVELIIDNDYRGLYILTEKIKRDKNRVDIAKLDNDDIAGDSLTGGYILRIDWLGDPGFESDYDSQEGIPMFFQWYYPKAEKIQPQQAAYIQEWMATFEEAVFAPNHTNSIGFRYNEYLNINSFTDFLLINELSKNADGYKLSTYINKEKDSKGGKLSAGPIWDFDQTYGVSLVCSNDDFTGWTYLQNQPDCEDLTSMPMWWQEMMSDDVFTNHLKCRWDTLRKGVVHQDSIFQWIDTHQAVISQAIDRNYTRWDEVIGESIWIEPEPVPETYEEEVSVLKNWITNRLNWLDLEMPGNCDEDILSVSDRGYPEVAIYPNPVSRQMTIVGAVGLELQIVDIVGRPILTMTITSDHELLDISSFSDGIYLLDFHLEGALLETKKIVVKVD